MADPSLRLGIVDVEDVNRPDERQMELFVVGVVPDEAAVVAVHFWSIKVIGRQIIGIRGRRGRRNARDFVNSKVHQCPDKRAVLWVVNHADFRSERFHGI
jgi:hypothetical protein